MTGAAESAAREALRARQGPGARYDAGLAPAGELALARRGTAYFARVLNGLPDEDFGAPSLVPGWTRARVIAHVGYNARALARLVEGARTGVDLPMYASEAARAEEIETGASLPPRALRNLFRHAAVHLDVEWRDLADAGWDVDARGRSGAPLPVRDTPWLRAQEVWLHAVDLDCGGSCSDFPSELAGRLLATLAGAAGFTFDPMPTSQAETRLTGADTDVSGRTPDLLRWLAGRGARRLAGDLPDLPGPADGG
ncbi:maleylpyruvate isomerase family mycothiol-dependent enzyme [Xanthobacter sp. DSM 24535]|uniref:maleylpyruvate isomerase family mycothiol-dependent enzyme n=1 Tax=Roseixanthobacter psychrophilus TaxID=3119917 RepID=UPI0037285CE6